MRGDESLMRRVRRRRLGIDEKDMETTVVDEPK